MAVSLQAVYVWCNIGTGKLSADNRDVLRGAGAVNIANNLIVHGCGIEEHDKHLFAVLDRLREMGLTVKEDKCEFRLLRLMFFGHKLTSDGINPSKEMIAAIRNARPYKDANEVR